MLQKIPERRLKNGSEVLKWVGKAGEQCRKLGRVPAPEDGYEDFVAQPAMRPKKPAPGGRKLRKRGSVTVAMLGALCVLGVGVGGVVGWVKWFKEGRAGNASVSSEKAPDAGKINAPTSCPPVSAVLLAAPSVPDSPDPSWKKCPEDCRRSVSSR